MAFSMERRQLCGVVGSLKGLEIHENSMGFSSFRLVSMTRGAIHNSFGLPKVRPKLLRSMFPDALPPCLPAA